MDWGDRDGNPNVNAITMEQALRLQSKTLFEYYLEEINLLGLQLSISNTNMKIEKSILKMALNPKISQFIESMNLIENLLFLYIQKFTLQLFI